MLSFLLRSRRLYEIPHGVVWSLTRSLWLRRKGAKESVFRLKYAKPKGVFDLQRCCLDRQDALNVTASASNGERAAPSANNARGMTDIDRMVTVDQFGQQAR